MNVFTRYKNIKEHIYPARNASNAIISKILQTLFFKLRNDPQSRGPTQDYNARAANRCPFH